MRQSDTLPPYSPVATVCCFHLRSYSVPNNGTSEASFARRRKWEVDVDTLLTAPRPDARPPLIWLGDLNVAAAWDDVGPNPDWFRNQNGRDAADPDDRGQPGFTANEQVRFARTLEQAGMVDAYRLLHPTADWSRDVTWRGTPGANGVPEAGRYYGKGMRIDYAIVPKCGVRVLRAEVLGHGAARLGFLGSDHCPLLFELEVDGAGSTSSAPGKRAACDDGGETSQHSEEHGLVQPSDAHSAGSNLPRS